MMSFAGSAVVEKEHVRLFVLLLRKSNLAWKFFLSIKSNWGLETNEVETLYNDHLNASQIFGSIVIN